MPVDIICPIHLTLEKKKSMSLAKSFQQELADGNICAIVILLLIFFFLQKHIYTFIYLVGKKYMHYNWLDRNLHTIIYLVGELDIRYQE